MLKKVLCLVLFWASSAIMAEDKAIKFDLLSPSGQVTEKDFEGKYLLMAIGYTSCPDICPTTLYEFGKALKGLNNPEAVQMLFITIDPVNDEINRLNAYTKYFDPRIMGLSGTMAQIQDFANQVGATFGYRLDGKKVDDPKLGMSYEVYHSALIYLISPDRKLVDVYDYQIGENGLIQALNKALPAPANGEGIEAVVQKSASETAVQADESKVALKCDLPKGFVASTTQTNLKDFVADGEINKPALLNLWAIWCAPCRRELPLLDKAKNNPDFNVLTLNLNDNAEAIENIFKELNIQHLSPQSTTADDVLERLGAVGLPFSALFVEGKQVGVKLGIISEVEMDALAQFSRCQTGS